jgi:anaerobic selenocysteine-containing dehydrogenase
MAQAKRRSGRSSRTTTDHEEIRRWVEERGGWPAEVEATARGDQTGILRIDFPGFSGEGKLRRIDWDEWFQKFDDASLALVLQETTAGGQRSNFNKIVARETAEARSRGVRTSRRAQRSAGGGARARSRSGAAGGRRGGRAAGARSDTGRGKSRSGTSRTAGRGGREAANEGSMRAERREAARTTGRKSARGRSTSSRRSTSKGGGRAPGGTRRSGGRSRGK